jgi:hypothetical protein
MKFIFFIFFIFIISCNNKINNYSDLPDGYYHKLYDSNGILLSKNRFSKDSIKCKEQIKYYYNNVIMKWFWQIKGNKFPLCGVYYNMLGEPADLIGIPILRIIKYDTNRIGIEIVNPPNVNFKLRLIDSFNKILLRKRDLKPLKNDSTSWVFIKDFTHLKGHNYYLYCYLVSKTEKLVDSMFIELFDIKGITNERYITNCNYYYDTINNLLHK